MSVNNLFATYDAPMKYTASVLGTLYNRQERTPMKIDTLPGNNGIVIRGQRRCGMTTLLTSMASDLMLSMPGITITYIVPSTLEKECILDGVNSGLVGPTSICGDTLTLMSSTLCCHNNFSPTSSDVIIYDGPVDLLRPSFDAYKCSLLIVGSTGSTGNIINSLL